MVNSLWSNDNLSSGSLQGKLDLIKPKVSIRQHQKFSSTMSQIMTWKEEFGNLLKNYPPLNEKDMNRIIDKRRELTTNLEHPKSIKERFWFPKLEFDG